MLHLDFTGTDRFRVLARLGAGGMGVVYRAHDRERGIDVALKTLHQMDAGGIYRLKQEFRSLADVSHPNLVGLHELVVDGDRVFFTMDLVEGVSFLEHVRVDAAGAGDTPAGDTHQDPTATAGSSLRPAHQLVPRRLPGGAPDLPRLRDALAQLAAGVRALHAAGKLHRDIKPSNIMVAAAGRVVLLDFGLVSERRPRDHSGGGDGALIGTPGYMSPEQGEDQPLGPASDWYSVGVVLFEALVGALPFAGSAREVLAAKARFAAPSPAELLPDLPDDLVLLCRELLATRPEERPGGEDIARRLGGARPVARALGAPAGLDETEPGLIGRDAELAALAGALTQAAGGAPVVVWVHGRSGIGKSALVERFLGEAAATVLAGRCYERESVPYKALDSVIDALSLHLTKLAPRRLEALLPDDAALLGRLFPVLRRVSPIDSGKLAVVPDPQELRRRGARALRELFVRLGRTGPLVVHIDDLQWGDLDSAALLSELLAPPDAPRLLLVAGYRREDAAESACLRALGAPGSAGDSPFGLTLELPVEPLTPGRMDDLVRALLPDAPAPARAAIVREAAGSPLLAGELARWHREVAGHAAVAAPTLAQVLGARCERLPPPARALLEVSALAGRPLPPALAERAATRPHADRPAAQGDGRAALAVLRGSRLVRAQGELLDTYHDRIRETVAQALPTARRRALHAALAFELEAAGSADPEFLATHLDGAGDSHRAGALYAAAAEAATAALAFDRAARLYQMALERLPDVDPGERQRLQLALGDALTNAGYGGRAADALLAAAVAAPREEALDLRRRAAEQQLKAGLIPQGLGTIEEVLRSVGIALPKRPGRALWSLLWRRARVRLRGLGFRERAESDLPQQRRVLIDTCWSMAVGLGMVDPIRGSDFGARHLLLALEAGEPRRIARALALEAAYRAIEPGGRRSSRELLRAAGELAERLHDAHARGLWLLLGGTSAYVSGLPAESLRLSLEAETLLRERCTGVSWELANAQVYTIGSLVILGRMREVRAGLIRGIHDAQARGDRYLETGLRGAFGSIPYVADGDLDGAQRDLDDIMPAWGAPGARHFHMQHCYDVLARTNLDLMRQDGAAALRRLDEAWPMFKSSFLLRAQIVRCFLLDMHGRAAIAAHRAGDRNALARAERDARSLCKEGLELATTWGLGIRACIAAAQGDPERARAALEAAARAADAGGFTMNGAFLRYRLAQLVGGDAGRGYAAAAEAWRVREEIAELGPIACAVTPGFRD